MPLLIRIPRSLDDKGEAAFRELYSQVKYRAKKKGREFTITREQYRVLCEGDCYYCGKEPSQIRKLISGSTYTYNGCDRVDNSKGYSVENLVSCCRLCNQRKRTMTQEEFLAKSHKR